MKIYLAGPCSSEHRTFMVSVAKFLRNYKVEVYCPWEYKVDGDPWQLSQEEWGKAVFIADMAAIESSDIMISISFGRISSCGTAFEQGYAYAKGIPVHVIQVTNEPTSLMTYWGSTSFINSDKNYGGIKSELRWILDNPRETNHGKCRTVLT